LLLLLLSLHLQVAAGGDPLGTLDFYSVHGYPIWGQPERDVDISMFTNPKSKWCLDKPIVVGEHWNEVLPNGEYVTPSNYVHLHQTGYAGAWGWAWFNVTEKFDPVSGVGVRGLGQHSCRDRLRQLLVNLPADLRYPLHASNSTTAGSGVAVPAGSSSGSAQAAATGATGASTADGQALPVVSG
jgi:hypothetical protein